MSLDAGRLGAAIVAAREARGWTQVQLADAAGIHENTVQNYEAGRPFRREPSTLKKIEKAFGVPLGTGMQIARGADPNLLLSSIPADHVSQSSPTRRSTLIDPQSPDPVIRELSTGLTTRTAPAVAAPLRVVPFQHTNGHPRACPPTATNPT